MAEVGRDDGLIAVRGDGDRPGGADFFAKLATDAGIGVDPFRKDREAAEHFLRGTKGADEVVKDLGLIAERKEHRQDEPNRKDRQIHLKKALPDDHRKDRNTEGYPREISALEPLRRLCGLYLELFTQPLDRDHHRVHRAHIPAVQSPENDREKKAYAEQRQPDKEVSLDEQEDEQGQKQYANDVGEVFHDEPPKD